jgi:hypothetical protein
MMYDKFMRNEMTMTTRYDAIMARVDAWADDYEGYDCRCDAADEVTFILGHPDYADWTDDRIVDEAIGAWLTAE